MLTGRFLQRCLFYVQRTKNYASAYQLQQTNSNKWLLSRRRYASGGGKMFVETENVFAHDVLRNSIHSYQIFDTKLNENDKNFDRTYGKIELETNIELLKQAGIDEIFKRFCEITEYCRQTETQLSNDQFRNFILFFCDELSKLTDGQLLEVLRQIAALPDEESTRAKNFVELWNNLDVECLRRLEDWNVDQMLLVCDAWYALKLARITEFVDAALHKVGRKVSKMRPEQLVHTMFFCNLLRRPTYEMFDFEANLTRCFDQLSLKELGVMSMGFFKTQTQLRNPELITKLYRRLMAELDTVEDITLVAILKILRYSTKLPQVDLMMELLDKLYVQLDRISIMSCLHVALLGCDVHCCHEKVIEKILLRYNDNIEATRLKDLERICLVVGLLNFRSESGIENELCAKILKTLQNRIDEILKYPRCFPLCLHYLSLKGFYDEEMLKAALDMKFILHTYGKNNKLLTRDIFCLDSFVKINLKDSYNGPQLPDKYRKVMGTNFTHYIPERNPKYKLNKTDRVLLEIKETTDWIHRNNSLKHILPHFERPDIVICYDKKNQCAIPLSSECPKDYSGVILTRKELLGEKDSNPDIDIITILVAGWNNVVRGKNRNTGLFDMKLKQLEILGYKYIMIYWHEWYPLETPRDRQHFIRRRLAQVIK